MPRGRKKAATPSKDKVAEEETSEAGQSPKRQKVEDDTAEEAENGNMEAEQDNTSSAAVTTATSASVDTNVFRLFLSALKEDELRTMLLDVVSKTPSLFEDLKAKVDLTEERFRKVFVVGFYKSSTETELAEFFSKFGPVSDVSIVRDAAQMSRCFGFVYFETFEGAKNALETPELLYSSETEPEGPREMKLRLAADPTKTATLTVAGPNPSNAESGDDAQNDGTASAHTGNQPKNLKARSDMTPAEDLALRKLFVRGLPTSVPSIDEASFRAYFEQFGPVAECNVSYHKETSRPRGYAFVTFQTRVGSMAFLNTAVKNFNGTTLYANLAEKDPNLFGGLAGTEETLRKVFVRGLSNTTTDDSLLVLMSEYGAVESCYVAKDKSGTAKGYGFCVFTDSVSAMKCLEDPVKSLDGRSVTCNLADRGKNRRDNLGGQSSHSHGQSHSHNVVPPVSTLPGFSVGVPMYDNSMSTLGDKRKYGAMTLGTNMATTTLPVLQNTVVPQNQYYVVPQQQQQTLGTPVIQQQQQQQQQYGTYQSGRPQMQTTQHQQYRR